MSIEIVVPALGESVSEATVAQWLKQVGDSVARDEALVELETDKVTLEVNATEAGTLSEIKVAAGDTVEVGAVLGVLGAGDGATAKPASAPAAAETTSEPAPAAAKGKDDAAVMPAAAKLIAENSLDAAKIAGTGKDGRITKGDVLAFLENATSPSVAAAPVSVAAPESNAEPAVIEVPAFQRPDTADRPKRDREERVRMSKLRKTIAARLKQAQNTAAMLTTFNEVDMTNLMAVRGAYKESFEKKHGIKLGFMSFFVKACIAALKELPAVNAEIDGDELVYKNYYDIGVAVSTPNGLVVPVLRDADRLSFAEIEGGIGDLGRRARDGQLSMAELTGGTFTVTNGGVFGSLLSTPILNPPQSGILGMHKIQKRPVAIGDAVEVRPMMYVALSYDHRIIDGREAVTFLVRVKEFIEDPQRILLDM